VFILIKSQSACLRPLKGFVAENGFIFESNGKMAEERSKGPVEKDLVDDSKDRGNNHNDRLREAGAIASFVSNEKEETNEEDFHEIKASESLIDGARIEQSTGIKLEPRYVEHVVAIPNPQKRKGYDCKDDDNRGNNGVD